MKKCLLLCYLFISVNAFAQNRTNVWELSYSTSPIYPNTEVLFHNGVVDTQSVDRIMSIYDTNTSICDTNGNLLFYTNGLTIGNRNYDTLQNAVNFNPGYATTSFEPLGMGIAQGAVIIPRPLNVNQYYIFYVTAEPIFAYGNNDTNPLYLSYSLIDMNLDNGLGGIVDSKKNLHAIDDTLVLGRLNAVKHANGSDWWVISHEYYTNKYYKLLVTPDSIIGPFSQNIGTNLKSNDIFGETVFSPDGSKFAMMNANNILDYMEFNRCSGEFYNVLSFEIPDSIGTYGCSFSSNNRFLYASSKYNLYQYDTWNPDMVSDGIHIAEWDSFTQNNVPVLFFLHQLGPDGKIYIGPFNGVSYLNVINDPDSLGIGCNFSAHSFVIPDYNVNVPSFPNYDLGAVPGGDTCNAVYTTALQLSLNTGSYSVAPNPVSDWLNIIYQSNEDALFELFDLYGKRVGAISLFHYFKNRLLNVSELPPGVYLAAVSCQGERVWSEKVVVQR